jgi:hypothetical protein
MTATEVVLLVIIIGILLGAVVAAVLLPQRDGLLPEEKLMTEAKFTAKATVTEPEEETEK